MLLRPWGSPRMQVRFLPLLLDTSCSHNHMIPHAPKRHAQQDSRLESVSFVRYDCKICPKHWPTHPKDVFAVWLTPRDTQVISNFAAKLGDVSYAVLQANRQVNKQIKERTIQTSKAIDTISDHHFTRGAGGMRGAP